jgi:hypothetical protein
MKQFLILKKQKFDQFNIMYIESLLLLGFTKASLRQGTDLKIFKIRVSSELIRFNSRFFGNDTKI